MNRSLFTSVDGKVSVLVPVLIGVVVILAVLSFFLRGDQAVPPRTGDESADGSTELVAFFDALNRKDFATAASYTQPMCEGSYCYAVGKTSEELISILEDACKTSVCLPVRVEVKGEDRGSGVRVHTTAFLNAEGQPQPYCLDETCMISKGTTNFRMSLVDGRWYVVDQPPPFIAFP